MSEYQYVAFRAIDAPVSGKNLEYMRRQSTRAEITPWSFENEYNFGDFHGNAEEMLRRGYDIHLHYANFGIRTILIRLPHGIPNSKAVQPYLDGESIQFLQDKKGRGGILSIRPYYEPDDLEELWHLNELFTRLVPLRAEILEGDLRPLYLAHLAVCCDGDHDPEETTEIPIPAGLKNPTDAQYAFGEFHGLSQSMIEAAAQNSPSLPPRADRQEEFTRWLSSQDQSAKDSWLADLLSTPNSPLRLEILAKFRKSTKTPPWPTVTLDQTIAQLSSAEEELDQQKKAKVAATSARQRANRLKKMAADPKPYLKEVEQLVAARSISAYEEASKVLAELREALADGKEADLPEKEALKLKKKHPTRSHLAAALRREGFLAK